MTLFHLYAAYDIVPTQPLRYTHVAFVMVLCFLLFPLAARFRNRSSRGTWSRRRPRSRSWSTRSGAARISPTAPRCRLQLDVVLGVIFIVLPAGGDAAHLRLDHAGGRADVHRLCDARDPICRRPGRTAATPSRGWSGICSSRSKGIFGVAVDVSSSLIILFTIYGAFLQHSGAGKFFIDFSLALMGGKPNSAGRTVVLSSFLLGGPSGSGVATTVTIGAVAYPMMERAGYEKNAAGGLLAAGGLGAILSPPVLGAAAFLIAEFLKISYLDSDLDGDHPDACSTTCRSVHGRARRQALRRGDGALRHLDDAVGR